MKLLTREMNCSHCGNRVEKVVEIVDIENGFQPRYLCVKCIHQMVIVLTEEWRSKVRVGTQLIVTGNFKEIQTDTIAEIGDVFTVQESTVGGILIAVREDGELMLISSETPYLHQLALAIVQPFQDTANRE